MKNEVLIIGADHYNTLWLVRSLGMAHFSPICIIVGEKDYSFVGASKYSKDCYIVHSYSDVLDLLMVMHYGYNIPIIASGDEAAAFLDEHYEDLSNKFVLHDCNGKGGQILYWMDKKKMLEQASASGLVIPFTKTFQLDGSESFCNIPFPCLIKPEISALASKKNFRVCNTIEELEKCCAEIKGDCLNVVLQEYIRPQYEYLVYGVRTKQNETIIPGGLRKIHTCSDTSSLGMMSYACCSEFIPSQLGNFDNIKNFLKALDYHGIFSIEFMITDEKAYFLEINLRNDGTVYCTTQAGVNIPALWAMSAIGRDITKFPHSYKRRKTYCINETNYVKYTLCQQSLMNSISEIKKTKSFSLIKWDDMKPVLAKALPSFFAFRNM